MSINTMEILKKHLESNVGDLGITIFNQSAFRMEISANPSKEEFETLISSLEKSVEKLFGTRKASLIFNNLRNDLVKYDPTFDKFFSYRFDDDLEKSLENKGLIRENEVNEIALSMISKGCEFEEEKIVFMIKRIIRKKILRDLIEKYVTDEVRSFHDKKPFYSEIDIEHFRTELKSKKIVISDMDLNKIFEKERLFRKFNFLERKESEDEDFISKYSQLFDPKIKNDYNYILTDAKVISMMKKNRILRGYFKRPLVSQKLRNSFL
ncbi:MAG: hypothetical protein OIN87_08760 [Candidatus Methanoperedens sp.]|nr:hypothetical protein [Candidatus Methanoperedens sp.]